MSFKEILDTSFKRICLQKLSFYLSIEHLLTLKNIDKINIHKVIHSAKIDLDIIPVPESRIIKNKLPPIEIDISSYSYEFCPLEANHSLIYVRNHLSYQPRNYLKIYKSIKHCGTNFNVEG